ncbi:DUF1080 domain-containing protein [Prevotella sp. 10(H)]|uniref:DUF1080 domain-containing protein n=1 Tax=Prevotella sp. 10(H) TaxID=1158294 RepID=UPI0004A76DAA|nr:family 16 glycoside hydrolase [Prevotella sp. 10(H)]
MKKIYILSAVLMCCSLVYGQFPANRTAKTIVADVLAQMPAQQPQQYNNQMKDLASTGEEGVLQLVKMMNLQDGNAAVEYALSGLSHYVSAEGMEGQRLVTANAYIKALDMVSDREVKAFIIRQLEVMGKGEAVEKLSSFLDNESLGGPAAAALSAIDTPESRKALLYALNAATSDKTAQPVILAMAKLKMSEAENALILLADSPDANKRKVVLYALSQLGSKLSLPVLAEAAERDNYSMLKEGGNEAYIALIKRLLVQGEVKEAEKAANSLMKKAQKAGQTQTREAALEIMMKAKPESAGKLLQNALKDNSRNYRMAALILASEYANGKMYAEIVKNLKKQKPEVQVDIMNWLNIECGNELKRKAIKDLGANVFTSKLTSTNFDVKKSAVEIIAKIGSEEAIISLVNLLKSEDNQTVALAEKLLYSVSGDICSHIATIIPAATDDGKIAALKLLASRKSTDYADSVLEQINNSSPEVKTTAYKALKDVVSTGNLPTLYSLLENTPADAVTFVQQAIRNVLKDIPAGKRLETITAQMNKVQKNKQYLYYPILTSTGDATALNIISERFSIESGTAKDGAFQALLGWNSLQVADELYTICINPSASTYFNRALERYIQLISNSDMTGENKRLFLTKAMDIAKTDEQKNQILSQLGRTNSYLAMLLAGQYLDQKAVQQSAAHTVMNIALNNKDFTGKNVEKLLNKVAEVLDNPDAGYQKEAIRKHLGEMPKEEGFISLFNGKDLSGWKGLVENPIARMKMKPIELAKQQTAADKIAIDHWNAEKGTLVFDGTGGNNLCTEKQYGDFEMYIDWKLDPAGKEADAGIYLRGTPQVQIWDISRKDVGAEVGSGGLYNNQSNPSKPLKVADNKLGEWNTFYIKMVGDRVTVKLNGELVVDNVILENYWDRSQPIFPIEQIELQAHGSKVYYRNIFVKELESFKPFQLSAQEEKESFKILFDGTNMHSWTGNTVDYAIEDGCISLNPKGGHGGNLYTKDEFSDFTFRFEFQLTPAANNGVGIRTPMGVDAAYDGMEIQILDHDHPVYKDITPLQAHGSVYGIIGAKRGFLKPVGEWNEEEITANGDHIKVTLNGTVILDGNIREATKNGTADGQQHPGLFNKKGYIGFLGHGSPLKFRNIRIKELNSR